MKFLLAFTFVATIQAYHPGYYQPYVVHPQLYQTFPNIRIPKPFMEQQIESRQRNDCKNNIGEVVPCYKSFAEKMDQSRIKPVLNRPVNPLFYSISQDGAENPLVKALPSIEDIEKACQAMKVDLKEGPMKDRIDSFREFAEYWDSLKGEDYDYYVWKLFGEEPSEEDLIFRKLTGIDKLFVKDLSAEMRNFDSSVADFIEETCANPSAEDAGAKFLNLSAKFNDIQVNLVPEVQNDENKKLQNYVETVCGYEKSQYKNVVNLEEIGHTCKILTPEMCYFDISDIYPIPDMVDIIQDIQENSKDGKCANRVTKYLSGLIGIMIASNKYFPTGCSPGCCSTKK